jgi:glycosyltransferase involved in cell wall biosynthesis
MRIVLVNWAKIWDGAAHGGGVNGYCQGLALKLVEAGHEVVSLCGGTTFEPGTGSRQIGPCVLRRHPDWLGIRVVEVINSPVLAPAMGQFRDPLGEVRAPALEALVEGLMRELSPDIVHFHNIEGFSAGCAGAVRRGAPGAKVFFSLHNYHTVCPQVYLMQGHRRPCHTYDGGHACTNCIPTVDPGEERQRLAFGGPAAAFSWNQPEPQAGVPRNPSAALRKFIRGLKAGSPAVRKGHVALPGGTKDVPLEVLRPSPHPGDDRRGQTARLAQAKRPHPWTEAGLSIPAWRPLLNVATGEPHTEKPPNSYARRRSAMIEMLNSCDRVLAVSTFVQRKFEALGVRGEILRTMHIGSRMPEVIAQRPECIAAPARMDAAVPRPIKMAFVGYHNWYKGLPMLADSLELLTPEVLGRIHLLVYALAGEEMEPQLRRLEPRLAGLTLRHGYTYDDLPWLLAGVDLGLVTSVWWDNGPQTVMEFLACGIPVLGAELGGIPDLIEDGRNGMLFRGNDRWDLARRLAEIVRDPSELDRLRREVKPPLSMAGHTLELERLYSAPLS